jgi:hypothetical protein
MMMTESFPSKNWFVMAGLVPAIHVLARRSRSNLLLMVRSVAKQRVSNIALGYSRVAH